MPRIDDDCDSWNTLIFLQGKVFSRVAWQIESTTLIDQIYFEGGKGGFSVSNPLQRVSLQFSIRNILSYFDTESE